ncbi:helix-turn-helix domain-containing protein [Bacillus sp. FSL W8-0102]|uniref:helix-turn-helix domain-containing protein n=1 Tax=Bacillus sp. FSL W8-0102 TaxID=2978205 RepID=UPI0030F65505
MYGFILGLLAASLLLFILSFFMKSRFKTMEQQLEEISLQFLQENYQVKKKLKVLEEELLMGDPYSEEKNSRQKVNEIIRNQVISLYFQGKSMDQIAKQSSLSLSQIKQILKPYQSNEYKKDMIF